MNHDAVDYFRVDFTPDESIVGGKYYPLGTFAAEALECGWNVSGEIHRRLKRFQEEFQVFLAARDPSSAATALHAMRQLWKVLEELPLYNKLLAGDHRMSALIPYLRRHPDILDEMMTPGTPRNEAYTRWTEKLERLEDDLRAFVRNTNWMLEEFFQELPTRRRQDYIKAYAGYRSVMEEAMNQKKDREDAGEDWEDGTVDLDTVSFEYPVNISLVPVKESKSHCLTLAEQMTFESLTSFLYMDLYKGMAAGNLPRRCAHCRRWFLAVGGYDTRYCDRVVPGTGGKTCRKVGAHEREKEKQKTRHNDGGSDNRYEESDSIGIIHRLLKVASDKYQDDEGYVYVSAAGQFIKRAKPDFDVRTYGFYQLSKLIEAFPKKYEIRKHPGKGNAVIVEYRCK